MLSFLQTQYHFYKSTCYSCTQLTAWIFLFFNLFLCSITASKGNWITRCRCGDKHTPSTNSDRSLRFVSALRQSLSTLATVRCMISTPKIPQPVPFLGSWNPHILRLPKFRSTVLRCCSSFTCKIHGVWKHETCFPFYLMGQNMPLRYFWNMVF